MEELPVLTMFLTRFLVGRVWAPRLARGALPALCAVDLPVATQLQRQGRSSGVNGVKAGDGQIRGRVVPRRLERFAAARLVAPWRRRMPEVRRRINVLPKSVHGQ